MNLRTHFTISRWFLPIAIMVIIFIFSSIPSKDLPDFELWDTLFKKGGHAIGYALLASSYLWCFSKNNYKFIFISITLTTIYALTDEFHQSFVPGRHAAFQDVLVDLSGAILGIFVYISSITKKNKN